MTGRDMVPAKPLLSTTPHMLTRGGRDRGLFSSDDNALTKQIVATHAPEIEELDVGPVLSIVEDILRLGRTFAAGTTSHGAKIEEHLHTLDDKKIVHSSRHNGKVLRSSYPNETILHGLDHESEIVKLLAFPINKISCEITCKCSGGGEAHSLTMDLLKSLSNYPWDAKVVITFAAVAVNYGEFWLVQHLRTTNPLAKSIAALKDHPETMDGELRKKFDAVIDLLNGVLNVTRCLTELKDLPSIYISHESPEMMAATAHVPTAVYWIIRSLLACASILLNLFGSDHEYITSTAESWEILSLAHKLSVILEHVQRQLAICKDLIDRKRAEDSYIAFKKLIETSHVDNMKVLRAMSRAREDQRPLYDGSRQAHERLDVLKSKYVLLLISDLDIPHEEVNILHMIYNQNSSRHEYEVLWLPIVDPSAPLSELQNTIFYELRNNNMPWHSVDHPSLVEPVAIRYIREVWKFVHMPMLVVLDPQGKPSNLDALPMMWIWGSNAFPFTKAREGELWSENGWNIELLADSIDPRIPDWIRENRLICLYGGEDIEWIRKFTLSARAVAAALNIPLEMLYVGKRNPKDRVRRCHEIIEREQLSHAFPLRDHYDYVWYFWARLWSMWNSKNQMSAGKDDDDPIMHEIMDVLTFDSTELGWAVFGRGGAHGMAKGRGDVVLGVLEDFSAWGHDVDRAGGFVAVLEAEIRRRSGQAAEHHCNRLILPGQAGYMPDRVVCSECGKVMERFVMYRCCTD